MVFVCLKTWLRLEVAPPTCGRRQLAHGRDDEHPGAALIHPDEFTLNALCVS